MRRFIALCLMIAGGLMFASGAQAQAWDFGPDTLRADGTGGGVILLGALNRESRLMAVCHPSRVATLAFLTDDRRAFPARPQDTGVTIEFDIDGFRTRAGAAYYEPGDGRLGLTLTDPALVRKVVEDVSRAKFGISLTIVNPAIGYNGKWLGGVGNAQNAARQFVDYCFKGRELPAEEVVAAPDPGPASTTGAWSTYTAPGGAFVLAGRANEGDGTLYYACDASRRITLLYLSDVPSSLPFGPSDARIGLDMKVDGLGWVTEAAYHADAKGAGIVFAGVGIISDMLVSLSVARRDVTMTLRAGGEPYTRTFGTVGAGPATQQFVSSCR